MAGRPPIVTDFKLRITQLLEEKLNTKNMASSEGAEKVGKDLADIFMKSHEGRTENIMKY